VTNLPFSVPSSARRVVQDRPVEGVRRNDLIEIEFVFDRAVVPHRTNTERSLTGVTDRSLDVLVVNEEPVKMTHTNLVRESFLQDPYDRQRPRRNGLSERRKGPVMSRFPLTKV
jgi:hypothetical protein